MAERGTCIFLHGITWWNCYCRHLNIKGYNATVAISALKALFLTFTDGGVVGVAITKQWCKCQCRHVLLIKFCRMVETLMSLWKLGWRHWRSRHVALVD
jgi:hypothetical protein